MNELIELMTFKKNGKIIKPISVIKLNNSYILSIYKGKKSNQDILIKYRQKLKDGSWSRIRTPKHIHWTVDILIKMSNDEKLTKQFIDKLINLWYEVRPFKTEKERNEFKLENLLNYDKKTISEFEELSKYGEYNIKFLVLLAQLLMLQEKSNYPEGKIFQKLLKKLKRNEDLFSIIQTATLKRIV